MILDDKRIRIIIGHYGSGKTEFCCNYSIELAKQSDKKVLLADLDIVNPYFRSRERASYLESHDVEVLSSILGNDVNMDIPALTAAVYAPLKEIEKNVILDVGGDKVGARVLRQYNRFIDGNQCDMFAVVNANRPETATAEGLIKHLSDIEYEAERKITGLINNTHMIWDTSVEDIVKGQKLLEEVSDKLGLPVVYISVIRKLAEELKGEFNVPIIPVDMIMRDVWM